MRSVDHLHALAQPKTTTPERVLIIEDDPDIAEILRYVIESENFEARIARTGEEGLSACLDKHNPPSLILLDLLLPGMSGIELCQRLHKESSTRSTPVVIVSAKASEKEIAISQELGVHHYIVKPFSVREVIACVNSILDEQQLMRAER